MKISKSSPEMGNILKMDSLYHKFSLIEKLESGNGELYVDISDHTQNGEYDGSDGMAYGGDISLSLSGGYLRAYKELLPTVRLVSEGGIVYVLKANEEELVIMRNRLYSEIPEIILQPHRKTTREFLRILSVQGGSFFGEVLKEGIPSIAQFIPLLYENCSSIEMNFSYMELGSDEFEVSVYLSYTFKEVLSAPFFSSYLSYDEDTRDIIFRGKRLGISLSEVNLLRVFIDEGQSALDISKIAETIAHNTSMSHSEMQTAKKNYIYNVRKGLNEKLKHVFGHDELFYQVGRNSILHFRFPEYIEKK